VPYFDKDGQRTVEPHPTNIRPQDSAVQEYVSLLERFGVCSGCRGEPWAVWSGSNMEAKQYPLLMVTWGTLVRSVYIAAERGAGNDMVQATLEMGL